MISVGSNYDKGAYDDTHVYQFLQIYNIDDEYEIATYEFQRQGMHVVFLLNSNEKVTLPHLSRMSRDI